MKHVVQLQDNLSAVVKKVPYRCVKCFAADRDGEIVTFGLMSPDDVEDTTEVFHWCSCGHKWIDKQWEADTW